MSATSPRRRLFSFSFQLLTSNTFLSRIFPRVLCVLVESFLHCFIFSLCLYPS